MYVVVARLHLESVECQHIAWFVRWLPHYFQTELETWIPVAIVICGGLHLRNYFMSPFVLRVWRTNTSHTGRIASNHTQLRCVPKPYTPLLSTSTSWVVLQKLGRGERGRLVEWSAQSALLIAGCWVFFEDVSRSLFIQTTLMSGDYVCWSMSAALALSVVVVSADLCLRQTRNCSNGKTCEKHVNVGRRLVLRQNVLSRLVYKPVL